MNLIADKKYKQLQQVVIDLGGEEVERKLKYVKFKLNNKIVTIPFYPTQTTIIFIEDIDTKEENNFHSLRKTYEIQIQEFKKALPLKCQLQKTNL